MNGIEIPMLQHRWKIQIDGDTLITLGTESCIVDFKNQTVELKVRHGITGKLNTSIFNLCKLSSFAIGVAAMTGATAESVYHRIDFMGARVASHTMKYDYAETGVINHRLIISFDSIVLMVPEAETEA